MTSAIEIIASLPVKETSETHILIYKMRNFMN